MSETPSTAGFQPKTTVPPQTSDANASQSDAPSQKSTSQPLTEADKSKAVTDILLGREPADDNSGSEVNVLPPDQTARADSEYVSDASVPSSEDSTGGMNPNTMTVKELATQLGTSPKKLYESLEIGLGDGETITLSEMKSQFKQQSTATRELVEREQTLSQRETQTLANLQLLQSVQDDLKGKLSPQVIQQLQERTEAKERSEQQLLFNAVPELRDNVKLDNFRKEVADTMAQFGFRPEELVIRDHRIALAMRELVQTKKQLAALMAIDPEHKQKPPKAMRPQRGNSKTAAKQRRTEQLKRARGGTEADKAAAVGALLRGS